MKPSSVRSPHLDFTRTQIRPTRVRSRWNTAEEDWDVQIWLAGGPAIFIKKKCAVDRFLKAQSVLRGERMQGVARSTPICSRTAAATPEFSTPDNSAQSLPGVHVVRLPYRSRVWALSHVAGSRRFTLRHVPLSSAKTEPMTMDFQSAMETFAEAWVAANTKGAPLADVATQVPPPTINHLSPPN